MTLATGADIAAWRASKGLTAAQAAPIIGLSRRSIEGAEACNGALTFADARRVNAAVAAYG